MNKFKFKLEGLLKLRKFEEQKVKLEIGQIVSEIQKTKDRIKQLKRDIAEGYEARDREMSGVVSGQFLHFFPMFLKGKEEDIVNNENLLMALERKYSTKVLELNEIRGKVKVVENLKEKELTLFKKKLNKKNEEKIQDILTMRRNREA